MNGVSDVCSGAALGRLKKTLIFYNIDSEYPSLTLWSKVIVSPNQILCFYECECVVRLTLDQPELILAELEREIQQALVYVIILHGMFKLS